MLWRDVIGDALDCQPVYMHRCATIYTGCTGYIHTPICEWPSLWWVFNLYICISTTLDSVFTPLMYERWHMILRPPGLQFYIHIHQVIQIKQVVIAVQVI